MVKRGATLVAALKPTVLLEDDVAADELGRLRELFAAAAARGEALLVTVF